MDLIGGNLDFGMGWHGAFHHLSISKKGMRDMRGIWGMRSIRGVKGVRGRRDIEGMMD